MNLYKKDVRLMLSVFLRAGGSANERSCMIPKQGFRK